MRSTRLLALAATGSTTVLTAAAPAIAVTPVRADPVAPALTSTLTKLEARTKLPILLPSTFPVSGLKGGPLHPVVSTTATSWNVDFGLVKNCNGANVCSAGFVGAVKTPKLPSNADGRTKVKLHGVTGRYRPLSCPTSCSPAAITFRTAGVNVTFALKVDRRKGETDRGVLTKLANEALDAGPR